MNEIAERTDTTDRPVAPNLFTIAPHAPFLPTLAARILDGSLLGDWPRTGPFWLSDVTVILPTRRAATGLADALLAAGGPGTLLPDIRTFGGEAEDEEPFLPPHDAPSLPRAIPPATRRLLLAELVGRWLEKNPQSPLAAGDGPNPVQVLGLSDSLATLIDHFVTEGIDPLRLADIDVGQLTDYWTDALHFLEIVFENWPALLREQDRVDQSALRNERLARQAETVSLLYDDRPVIAAGSTGSIPATAHLMRRISRLRRGALVLPGLDSRLGARALAQLRSPAEQPHGHAQYNLVHLLDGLGAGPDQVEELAPAPVTSRTHIVRRALDLAADTAHWHEARAELSTADFDQALEPVSIAAARGEQEQALAVALASRQGLETGRTVGIIAPDRNLARRIVTELARFDIAVDDSAGTPLHQSRAGRLARQVVAIVATDFAPVDVMALLRNRHVTLGRNRATLALLAEHIEFGLLRGQRPAPGLKGLRAVLEANVAGELDHVAKRLGRHEADGIGALIDHLDFALSPLMELFERPFTAADLAASITTAIAALMAPAPGERPAELVGGDELDRWAEALADSPYPGPRLDAESAEPALAQLMAGFSVRATRATHPDIAIWGRLEARLQPADLMILTALNEGSWPEVADPGPWLSRQMRLQVGLAPPERQHGLAAHDFEMALGAPEVLLTYAGRVGTSPATPSRLLQRLEAFMGPAFARAAHARGEVWLDIARRLDAPAGPPRPAARPAPRPPAARRPHRLSITRVEQLIRSPYDLYARHTLGLTALEPLGTEPGARERGTFIHEVFARFVAEDHDPLAADAQAILVEMATEAFSRLETNPERRDIWLRRFAASARKYLAFEAERAPRIAARHAEQDLSFDFDVAGEPFNLHGRADRIDVMTNGNVEIIDFKTGGVPGAGEMRQFLAPQLLLEALIVGRAGFGDATSQKPPRDTDALTYIRLGANPTAFETTAFALPGGMDITAAADEMFARLNRHIAPFLLSDTQPMTAAVLPRAGQRFAGDYDHLARLGEWAGNGEEAE